MWWLLVLVPVAAAAVVTWLSGSPPARRLPSDRTLERKIGRPGSR